jgi:tRNA (guanine-N7-)-methyltransferase
MVCGDRREPVHQSHDRIATQASQVYQPIMPAAQLKPESVLFDPEPLPKPLDWALLFPHPGPLEIEVGCGKGRFLLARAEADPGYRFVGLEFARAYLLAVAERAARRNLRNVRVARYEAARFFRESVPDSSVSAFHLLYPDPWPKKRHHKRRLVQDDFLDDLRRTLCPGAVVNIATDHEDYFEWMMDVFGRWKGTFVMEPKILATPEELAGFEGRTNYEVKYAAAGCPLYFLTGRRTGF